MGVVVVMSVVIVSGCELMCSTGMGSWVCDSGCCSTGARIMSSWPEPIITIRSMMLKINRFIVMCDYSRPLSAYEKYLFCVMMTWSRT